MATWLPLPDPSRLHTLHGQSALALIGVSSWYWIVLGGIAVRRWCFPIHKFGVVHCQPISPDHHTKNGILRQEASLWYYNSVTIKNIWSQRKRKHAQSLY